MINAGLVGAAEAAHTITQARGLAGDARLSAEPSTRPEPSSHVPWDRAAA